MTTPLAHPAAAPATLMLSVPIALPSAEEVREIIRAAALTVAERQTAWLRLHEAAAHCGWSVRTFQRRREELGIPYSEIYADADEDADRKTAKRVPTQRYFRGDLDAVMAAHLVCPEGPQIIPFPSLALRAGQTQSSAA